VQSGERRLQSRDYRSVTLSLCGPAAPSLHRSTAPPLRCRGGALLRAALLQGSERAERRERRLQSGERGACRAERGATEWKRRRHTAETEAPHSRNGGGTQQKRRRHTAETEAAHSRNGGGTQQKPGSRS